MGTSVDSLRKQNKNQLYLNNPSVILSIHYSRELELIILIIKGQAMAAKKQSATLSEFTMN